MNIPKGSKMRKARLAKFAEHWRAKHLGRMNFRDFEKAVALVANVTMGWSPHSGIFRAWKNRRAFLAMDRNKLKKSVADALLRLSQASGTEGSLSLAHEERQDVVDAFRTFNLFDESTKQAQELITRIINPPLYRLPGVRYATPEKILSETWSKNTGKSDPLKSGFFSKSRKAFEKDLLYLAALCGRDTETLLMLPPRAISEIAADALTEIRNLGISGRIPIPSNHFDRITQACARLGIKIE